MPTFSTHRWVANTATADPTRRVLVLPGANYPIELPTLYFPCRALADAGWTVWHATWDLSNVRGSEAARVAVEASAKQLAAEAETCPGITLLLGKSVGSLAAGWAARTGTAAAWLTPLLRQPGVAKDIARSGAPKLLVGGTADQHWDSDAAADSGASVLELAGCGHTLEQGDWRAYLRTLETMTDAVVEFAAALEPRAC